MNIQNSESAVSSAEQLCSVKCVPCEGGVPKMTGEEAAAQLQELEGWEILSGPDRIRKTWVVRNFVAGMEFFQAVTSVAEAEGHHPDLHLVGYRNLSIEIWTHAIGGLSLNDFILAAKIDRLPIRLKG
ncbi:MAG: 4a-hydroxytetrahydrobiopterin dehydratase [Planctomycetaceae bacterium]|nr:4a-hydroxytetrahydrobiopterin dehydratase [Planctomycetaceae bacterium]